MTRQHKGSFYYCNALGRGGRGARGERGAERGEGRRTGRGALKSGLGDCTLTSRIAPNDEDRQLRVD